MSVIKAVGYINYRIINLSMNNGGDGLILCQMRFDNLDELDNALNLISNKKKVEALKEKKGANLIEITAIITAFPYRKKLANKYPKLKIVGGDSSKKNSSFKPSIVKGNHITIEHINSNSFYRLVPDEQKEKKEKQRFERNKKKAFSDCEKQGILLHLETYVSTHHDATFTCSKCDTTFTGNYRRTILARKHACLFCYKKDHSPKGTYNLRESKLRLENYAKSIGMKVDSNQYTGRGNKIDWMCKEGHLDSVSFRSMKLRGNKCKSCKQVNHDYSIEINNMKRELNYGN